ncbi:MAG: MFS transporter [Candidatus Lokiarchaeota archaeon]|nr:MFS transporter [Candidatus Lokiarchaeota archaeon]MBD3337910.1 MFS transporter [Candidatus Lokiarchaeota archaeon]
MNETKDEKTLKKLPKQVTVVAVVVGFLAAGAQIYGYFESSFFNTYLDHILNLPYYYISIMVSLSATMGLIMMIIWGIKSDNTRSKLGRRKPFLFGGFVMCFAMIAFAFAENFIMCLILDVLILGIASNAYHVATRSFIPDLVEPEHRGRANGIAGVFGNIGLLTAIALTLVANEFFTVKRGEGNILTREGHLFLFIIGGVGVMICAIIGLLFIREPSPSEMPPKKRFIVEFREMFNIEEFKQNQQFYRILVAQTIFRAHIYVVLPFLFNYLFFLALTTLELFLVIIISFPVIIGIMMLLGRIADKFGRRTSVVPSILIACVGFFLMPFAALIPDYKMIILLIGMPLVLLGLLGLEVPLNAWSQDLFPKDKRGKFIGILNVVNTVSQIIGATVGGIVATLYGLPWVFAFAPIFLVLSIFLFRKVDETLKLKIDRI